MIFSSKNKPIKLEMYAPVGQLVDLFPPVPMQQHLPTWWSAINTKTVDNKTVKHCPGFRDLYKRGIALPLWSDYEVVLDQQEVTTIRWPTQSNQPGASRHGLAEQAPGAWPGYVNIKFLNPWKFHCTEPVEFVWVQPVWGQENPQEFTLVPGVVDFYVNKQANINTLWKLGHRKTVLKAGTIMAQLIPLTTRPLEISYHVMTNEDFNKKFAIWDFTLGLAQYAKSKLILRNKHNE